MINYNTDICFKANTKTLDYIITIQNINANKKKKKCHFLDKNDKSLTVKCRYIAELQKHKTLISVACKSVNILLLLYLFLSLS